MALQQDITADDGFFTGEDAVIRFTVYTSAAKTTCINIAGWALSWMVKKRVSDADSAAKVTKTTAAGIAITGVFNASPALNTQRAEITIADSDTMTQLVSGVYRHELKRTDAGSEQVLAYGTLYARRSVHAA